MNIKLESLLEEIVGNLESLLLDDANDRKTLVKALSKSLTPIEYHQVERIAQALFPSGDVEESFDGELSIYTGLFNVAEGGAEEAFLVDVSQKHVYDNNDLEEVMDDGIDWD